MSKPALPGSFEDRSEMGRRASGELPSPASLQAPETAAAAAPMRARHAGASAELAAAAERDRRLVALVHTSYPFLWRTLRRVGVAEVEIDDVLEQVFLVVHRRLDGIGEGGERAFLVGLALRVACARCESMGRRRGRGEGSRSQAADPVPAREQPADRPWARALLDELLGGMSLKFRTVFVLFELEGLALSEIAELLEIPVETVGARIRRARELFRRAVARQQPSALDLEGRP